MEDAKTSAWKRLVAPTVQECHEFLEYQTHEGGEQEKKVRLESQEGDHMDSTTDDADPWWQQFCLPSSDPTSSTEQLQPRIRYPAEVLPIMVISSPLISTCLVDQHAIVTTIWKEWNAPTNTKDLSLFLPRLLPTLTDTLHVLADGLATLLKQSPMYSNCWHLLHSRKKRKRVLQSSIQDWILDVMQSLQVNPQNAVDADAASNPQDNSDDDTLLPNFVIVLQNDVASSNVVKQQFLQQLTAWRSLKGVPVSLVVLESSPNGPDGSLSTMLRNGEDGMSGRFGRRVTYLTVPSSANASTSFAAATALWVQFFLEALEPVPIPLVRHGSNEMPLLPLLEWTQQSIAEGASCSRMADRLCRMIMEFFSQPGSFVWDSLRWPSPGSDSKSVNGFQPSFCAWFCVYEKAQITLSQSANDDQPTTAAEKCKALLECHSYVQPAGPVRFWWSMACALLPLQVWVLCEKEMSAIQSKQRKNNSFSLPDATFMLPLLARSYKIVTACLSTTDDMSEKDEAAQILARYLQKNKADDNGKHETNGDKNGVDTETLGKLKKMIGELVLVISKFRGESTVETTIDGKEIKQGISQMIMDINHVTANQLNHWTRRWMYTNPLMKWMNLGNPSLRKDIGDDDRPPRIPNIRRDVVAGLNPSAKRLLGVMQDQMTITKDDWFRAFGGSMEEFCVGLWTLQMTGLVQLKKGTGNGANKIIYERVSVVWC